MVRRTPSILQNLPQRAIFLLLLFLANTFLHAQENPLDKIMQSQASKIKTVADQLDQHQVQVLYLSVNRDEKNQPSFTAHRFQQEDSLYFYPASTVKLPIAVLALQKIKQLNAQGIAIRQNTPFHIIDPETKKYVQQQDSTHPKQELTIGHLIKKIFLVSDNDAYNYLFDFIGKTEINAALKRIGIEHTVIRHKFLFGADNQNTWEYVFFNNKDTLYHQKSIHSKQIERVNLKSQKKGKAYLSSGEKVLEPMDFSFKNWMALSAHLEVIKRLIFPNSYTPAQRFDLTTEQLEFLRFWMSRNTKESQITQYNNSEEYYDSYGKFFLYGDTKGEMREDLRIYNKVGYAYGTLTDVAYINDTEKGIEFLLAATVLVNENQTFNDNIYEFETKGIPFLAEIGRQLYAHELQQNQ